MDGDGGVIPAPVDQDISAPPLDGAHAPIEKKKLTINLGKRGSKRQADVEADDSGRTLEYPDAGRPKIDAPMEAATSFPAPSLANPAPMAMGPAIDADTSMSLLAQMTEVIRGLAGVAEVFCDGKVANRAIAFGLVPGVVADLENGCDLDDRQSVAKLRATLKQDEPTCVIL